VTQVRAKDLAESLTTELIQVQCFLVSTCIECKVTIDISCIAQCVPYKECIALGALILGAVILQHAAKEHIFKYCLQCRPR